MDKDMEQQLNNWREKLRAEVMAAEAQLEQLRKDVHHKREKMSALDQLLGRAAEIPIPLDASADSDDEAHEETGLDGRDFTPVHAYWMPILETLIEFGGAGARLKVIARVGEKMKSVLKPADYDKLPNSYRVRWQNRVPWQVSSMKEIGLIRKDAGRGIWEITPKGRKWLDDNR
jgi:Mrr N-terminal domain